MDFILIIQLASLVILLILSGYFSSIETAFTSLSMLEIKKLVKDKAKNSKLLEQLKTDPNKIIITILIGNNSVNIGASSLATIISMKLFGSIGIGIAIGLITLLVLIFGEITPKAYAIQNAAKLSLNSAKPLYYLEKFFSPGIFVLSKLTNAILKLIGGKTTPEPIVSRERLKFMATLGVEEGTLEELEKLLIHRVIEFNNVSAEQVMTPRTKIKAINIKSKPEAVRKLIFKTIYSRLPVYDGTVDNIVGILLVKEFLKAYTKNKKVSLHKTIYPAYFVPSTKKIDDLFKEFQDRHTHIAIVADEHGGTAGLITLEDVMEELVGEIFDETDMNKHLLRHINRNTIKADASISIREVDEALEASLPSTTMKSIGSIRSFILSKLGRLPKEGEAIKLGDVTIVIEKMKKHVIEKVKIVKNR